MNKSELIYNKITEILSELNSSFSPFEYFYQKEVGNNSFIESIPTEYIEKIDNIIEELTKEEFHDLMEYTILKRFNYPRYKDYLEMTPFLSNLLDLKEEDNLFLLTSQHGLFARCFLNNNKINSVTVNSISSMTQVILKDFDNYSIISETNNDNDYTKMFMFNHFRIFDAPIENRNYSKLNKFIHIFSNSNKVKKAVLVVDERFLYNIKYHNFLESLIESGYVEGIISRNDIRKNVYLVLDKENIKTKTKLYVMGREESYTDAFDNYKWGKTERYLEISNDKLVTLADYNPEKVIKLFTLNNSFKNVPTVKLSDVCEINIGSQYTSKVLEERYTKLEKRNLGETFQLLRPSDIDDDGQIIDYENLPYYSVDKINKERLAKRGDILINSKTTNMKVCVLDEIDGEVNIIPTGGMFIIKIKDRIISPYYLKAFFESKHGQELLSTCYKGSVLKVLTLQEFSNIEIPLIDRVKLHRLDQDIRREYHHIQNSKVKIKESRNQVKALIDNVFDI